jgi:large subunit ribosomal protein L24
MRLHIKKGDTVKVLVGKKDANGVRPTGTVLRVFPKTMKAIVEGVNLVSKHTKPNVDKNNPKGGVIQKEAPIHISNLMVVDSKGIATRTRKEKNEKGFSVRVSLKSGEIIK